MVSLRNIAESEAGPGAPTTRSDALRLRRTSGTAPDRSKEVRAAVDLEGIVAPQSAPIADSDAKTGVSAPASKSPFSVINVAICLPRCGLS